MKRWIASVTLVLVVIELLCFSTPTAKTAKLETQVSEAELTKKFNAILDGELSGDNVCVTTPAARRLNALMTSSAAKIVRENVFTRVPEAERNIRVFARTLLAAGDSESGRTRISPETIDGLMKRGTGITEPPDAGGGSGRVSDLLCPLFPIC
ncbi:MAG TPA: hypothetical protein VN844_03865 [Pyrinomonadaceae bacterium]|nr:hypothetical protein [Pyrinomonadaceae bacterium]